MSSPSEPFITQKMMVHRQGAGEPLLLVHGICSYSVLWDPLLPLLTPHCEVITVDLAGCGQATMSAEDNYSLPAHCERIKALLDQLQITRVHLVGHDVGGGIAQLFAVRYPERLIDLTLMNPVGYDYWPVQPITLIRAPILRQLAMAALNISLFTLLVKRAVFHQDRVNPALITHLYQPLQTREGRKAFLRFAKHLNNEDLLQITPQLRQLTVKTLLIRAKQDHYLSNSICHQLNHDIPNSILVRIDHAGHFIQIDQPEQISQALLAFMGLS